MMDAYWPRFQLTDSLRPVLLEQEIELVTSPQVSIYHGDTKVHRSGMATVTSHRILWMNDARKPTFCIAMSLEHVLRVESKAGFFGVSSPKIMVYLKGLPVREVAASPAPSQSQPAGPPKLHAVPPPGYLQLSFHSSSRARDDFLDKIVASIQQATWEQYESKKPAKLEFSTSQAGIHGIMRNVKQSQLQNEKVVDEAFSDLKALMAKAKDMVELVSKYTVATEAKHKKDEEAPDDAESEQKAEADQMSSILLNLGIASPVTRLTAGAEYHIQLARQLTDFMKEPLRKAGGMLTLTDVYCIYNRARGTELVSPDDLLQACRLFAELGLHIQLRKFDSGVVVLQSAEHSDKAMALRILRVIQDALYHAAEIFDEEPHHGGGGGGDSPRSVVSGAVSVFSASPFRSLASNRYMSLPVDTKVLAKDAVIALGRECLSVSISALDLSQAMSISLTLAKQHLLNAEGMEFLARDRSSQGLRFHANCFQWIDS